MKSIYFQQTGKVVNVNTEDNVLKALLAERVPVVMACGGRGLCATCHVYVESGMDGLTPCSKREKRTLSVLGDAKPNSRLACQSRVLRDGVVVRLPDGLYVQNVADLEELIGRRAEKPLLHPVNGRILVPTGKILTRTVLQALQHVETDLATLMQESREI